MAPKSETFKAKAEKALLERAQTLGVISAFDPQLGDERDQLENEQTLAARLETVELQSIAGARIQHALEKIRQGTYGICEECGGKIAASRLDAIPEAEFCKPCQQEAEASGEAPNGVPSIYGDLRIERDHRNDFRKLLGDDDVEPSEERSQD